MRQRQNETERSREELVPMKEMTGLERRGSLKAMSAEAASSGNQAKRQSSVRRPPRNEWNERHAGETLSK